MSEKRMFEFVEGSASKFWEIWRTGGEVRTRYGRIGSAGQTTVKDEGTDVAGQKLYDKLVREKTSKGYVEQGAAAPGAVAAPAAVAATPAAPKAAATKPKAKEAPVNDDDDDDDGDDDDDATEGEARYEVDGKFWAISLDGSAHTVRFGKIGSDGTSKTKEFDDEDDAKKDHDRLVKEKTNKGYELVSGGASKDDEDEDDEDEDEEDEDEDESSEDDDDDDDDSEEDDDDDDSSEDDGTWRRFELDGKFWAIQIDGASHTVRYGKIGSDGTEKTKDFDDEAAAQQDADELIEEKSSKGFEEQDK